MTTTIQHGRRIILRGGYVFEVEHQHAEHLDVLDRRANAYPELVAALREFTSYLGAGSVDDLLEQRMCSEARALLAELEAA